MKGENEMSVNEIYAVYDDASQSFVQFLPCLNENVAMMTFSKMFKEKRLTIPLLYDYPNCFKVLKLGTFDDNTGLFTNLEHQNTLLEFSSLLKPNDSINSPSS